MLLVWAPAILQDLQSTRALSIIELSSLDQRACLEKIWGAVPWSSSSQALIQDAAQGIHIHLLVQVAAVELLWSHVDRRATCQWQGRSRFSAEDVNQPYQVPYADLSQSSCHFISFVNEHLGRRLQLIAQFKDAWDLGFLHA